MSSELMHEMTYNSQQDDNMIDPANLMHLFVFCFSVNVPDPVSGYKKDIITQYQPQQIKEKSNAY